MESDFEWGDLQQERPSPGLRPDRNPQLVVVPYGDPRGAEIPVYIDVDVFAEIEEHANSDPGLELGGVLLGGQHEDESGSPFVVVRDALRAECYENSRGSFKFTHDSWEAISRRREQFPSELRMVGWYHTHPGWGVFLSGPDQFICEHFFNRPLDVAYVVDPLQGLRDFFCWSSATPGSLPACRGFWVFGSRFRELQIQRYVAHLQGKELIMDDLRRPNGIERDRFSSRPERATSAPDASLQRTVLLSLVVLQCLLLVLLGWQVLTAEHRRADPRVGAESPLAERERQLDLRSARLDAQEAALERLISVWDGTPDTVVATLRKHEEQGRQLREDLAAYQSRARLLDEERVAAAAAAAAAERRVTGLDEELQRTKGLLAEARERQSRSEPRDDAVADATATPPAEAGWLRSLHPTVWGALGALLGACAGSAITWRATRQLVPTEAT